MSSQCIANVHSYVLSVSSTNETSEIGLGIANTVRLVATHTYYIGRYIGLTHVNVSWAPVAAKAPPMY